MSGFLELKCEIIRGGMEKYLTPMGPTKLHVHPIFEISPLVSLPRVYHRVKNAASGAAGCMLWLVGMQPGADTHGDS
jgi:hypothetical protein